jgi:hypothetical protein
MSQRLQDTLRFVFSRASHLLYGYRGHELDHLQNYLSGQGEHHPAYTTGLSL